MAADYRQQAWPLAALPLYIWRQLCDQLDGNAMGNGYPLLADGLRYSPQQIELFAVRCGRDQIIPNSPTYMFLADYAQRGGTIQQVQFVLERMEHAAANTIPQNLATVYRGVSDFYSQRHASMPRQVPSYQNDDGYQNTEQSICNCSRCLNFGANQQPVQSTYPEERFRLPRSPPTMRYQRPPGYQAQHRQVHQQQPSPPPAYREFSTPLQAPARTGRNSVNDQVGLLQQTIHPGTQQVTSHQHVRSELGENANTRVCEHCRRQADPDETVVMTVSGEKTPRCECAYTNLALTSVFRQSPIGETNSDSSTGTSDNSIISSSFEINPGDTTRWTADPGDTPRRTDEPGDTPRRTDEPGETPRRTAVQRNGRIQPDTDRHSWPSSSSDGGDNEVRNCSSDSRLSLHRARPTTNQQVNQNDMHIVDTLLSRISGSNVSDLNQQFHNNLDIDDAENARDENDNIEQNIAPSNSMNETSRQTSRSNTQSSTNPAVYRLPGTTNLVRVFVTYAWNAGTDSQTFLKEVVECCQQLKNAGARVKIDMDEMSYSALRLNKLDWIDRNMQQADFIVVCITPTYLNDVMGQTEQEESPRISQLNARYVFDKLRQEYFNNNSVNRRVIPVIFPNYQTSEQHVPQCMRTTLIHAYPNNANSIVEAVFCRGRYRPT